jgi:hypothetical protein
MAGESLLAHYRPPWRRGITGRTLTVALLMTGLICRRLARQGLVCRLGSSRWGGEAWHSLADAWLRR